MPTTKQVQKMTEKLRKSDRLQYFIGTLISIVLLSGYLILSGDQEEKSTVAETNLPEISVGEKEPREAKHSEEVH